MKKQAGKKAPKVKLTKSEQKDREKALDKKLSAEALPKYLTEGLVVLDKDVLCENVSLYTPDGKIELVKSARVQLLQGRRYGLIGKNGIGKTTLLNQISGYKLENFPQYLRVMHVRQEANIASDMPVLEFVVKSDELKAYLESEEARVLEAIEEGDTEDVDGVDINVKLDKIYERLEDINARTAEGRARQILLGLQFSDSMISGPTKALSGGWRVRVALACALFVQPDILLLDEPTNHLDFPAVDWLISYLKVYTKTCIVVSHDRGFLNNVITDVMDMHDQKLDYYRGDYDAYVKTREENLKLAQRNYDKQEKERTTLKQFIEEAKRSKNRQVADMAASRQARLDKLEVLEAPVFEKPWSFTFPDPGSLDHAIVSLIKMTFGWDETKPDKPLLKNVDGFVDMKSRIGVLGANGAGKTTLINLILGKLKPWSGQLRLNEQARTVLFTQHHMDQLDMHLTPLEYIQKMFPSEKEGRIRGFLGHFGFDQNLISHKIGTLSGGQKSRVAFAILSWNNPHCIIMDEPTNHLDLQTVEALATSLKTFEGGVILISHDIYFLSEVAEVFWAVNTAGDVKEFHDLDEAKAFSYKPILYKPLEAMQEETKEVKEAFAAKKAAEAAVRAAEYAKKMAALDREIENIKVESVASMDYDNEHQGEPTGDAEDKNKKGGKKGGKKDEPKKGDKADKKEEGGKKGDKAKEEKKPKAEPKELLEQYVSLHVAPPKKKAGAGKAAPVRPEMNMSTAGFGALELSEEEVDEVEEAPKEKKKKKKAAEGEEGEKEKKKKKKDKGEDGEDGEKEKKEKKKDKGEVEAEEGEDGEKGKKKKKKKEKGGDDEAEGGEDGEKEKKKKKKEKVKEEGDAEEGEEKEKKKKKKKDQVAEEGEETGEGETEKKKKKKEKVKEAGEQDATAAKVTEDKEVEEDAEDETDKKKKKKKEKENTEGDEENGKEKKKKKKKDKEAEAEEGEAGEAELEETEQADKKKKKKKSKDDVDTEMQAEEGEEESGKKKDKKKKDKGEEGGKKKKKDKAEVVQEEEEEAPEETEGTKGKQDKKKNKAEKQPEEESKGKKKDKNQKKDKSAEDEAEENAETKDEEEDGGKKGKKDKSKKEKGKKKGKDDEAGEKEEDKEETKEIGAKGGKKKNRKNKDDEEDEESVHTELTKEEQDADAIERRERLARLDAKAQSKKEKAAANTHAEGGESGEVAKTEEGTDEWGAKQKGKDKGKQKKKQQQEEEEQPKKKKAQEDEENVGKKGKKGKGKKGGDDEDEEEEESGKKKKKGTKTGGDDDEEEDGAKKKKKGGKKGVADDDEEKDGGKKKKKGGKKGGDNEDEEEDEGKQKKKDGKKSGDDEEEEEDDGGKKKKKGGKKAAEDDVADKKNGKSKKSKESDDEEAEHKGKAEEGENSEDERLINLVKGVKGLSVKEKKKAKGKAATEAQDGDEEAPEPIKGKKSRGH